MMTDPKPATERERIERVRHEWHVAINRHHYPEAGRSERSPWMYAAKDAAGEVYRLPLLFKMEREGTLPKIHRQCSHSAPAEIVANALSCCLGVKCATCPQLLALDAMKAAPDDIDRAKAWTCVAHILSEGGDVAGEGFVLTTDDRMYWDNVYSSLSGGDPDGEAQVLEGA